MIYYYMGNCFSRQTVNDECNGRLSSIRKNIEIVNESIDGLKHDHDELERFKLENEELKRLVYAYGLEVSGHLHRY